MNDRFFSGSSDYVTSAVVQSLRPSITRRAVQCMRSIYLSRIRRRFSYVGVGFFSEPHVHFEGSKNITIGDYVRLLRGSMLLANKGKIKLGFGSTICRYAILETAGGFIHIGEGSLIGDFTSLYGQGGLTIGKHVQIASGCRIVPKTTSFGNREMLIGEEGYKALGISIHDNVWLGVNCVVLDGVTIGTGTVIGAGAVVTKSIPENSVAIGIPAKVIRSR